MESRLGTSLVRELAQWRPEGGVVSAYVEIDPADRGEGWRIALREGISGLDPELQSRVLARFPENAPHPEGRLQVGFLEAGKGGREIWHGVQWELGETRVEHTAGPILEPLVRILDEASAIGVAVIALERIRVLEWSLGRIEELAEWELETNALDWQERRGPVRNPQADGTGTTSSGREQHMQRLEHNRERFLKQAGHLLGTRFGDRDWRRIVLFGEGDRPRHFAAGLGERARLVHEVPTDLIRAGAAEIGERIGAELEHLNREREEELVRRVEEAIGGARGAALGPTEVLQALGEGRVRHLIFAAGRDFDSEDGVELGERMISLALATSADVTPVEGLAAQALEPRDGAVALLRY